MSEPFGLWLLQPARLLLRGALPLPGAQEFYRVAHQGRKMLFERAGLATIKPVLDPEKIDEVIQRLY